VVGLDIVAADLDQLRDLAVTLSALKVEQQVDRISNVGLTESRIIQ
jgi:hypothetical protein